MQAETTCVYCFDYCTTALMIHVLIHDLKADPNSFDAFFSFSFIGSHGIRWPCLLNLPYIIIPFYYGAKLLFQGRPEEELGVHF